MHSSPVNDDLKDMLRDQNVVSTIVGLPMVNPVDLINILPTDVRLDKKKSLNWGVLNLSSLCIYGVENFQPQELLAGATGLAARAAPL